jgi:hypothetical protein
MKKAPDGLRALLGQMQVGDEKRAGYSLIRQFPPW